MAEHRSRIWIWLWIILLFLGARLDRSQIRDLQRRIAVLEQRVR